jgi:hypothetical protein
VHVEESGGSVLVLGHLVKVHGHDVVALVAMFVYHDHIVGLVDAQVNRCTKYVIEGSIIVEVGDCNSDRGVEI